MRKIAFFFIVSFCLFVFVEALTAQVPSKPEIIAGGKFNGMNDLRSTLSKCYAAGKWTDLQAAFAEFKPILTFGGHAYDPSKNFYIVVFLSSPENGEPRLIRFPYGNPVPDPYANRIPGKNEIFEIVLGAQSDLSLDSSYVSTKVEDPHQAQIPKAVKMLEPIFGVIFKLGTEETPPRYRDVNFEFRSVSLPFDRAKISITDVATLSGAALATAIKTSVTKLSDLLVYRTADGSKTGPLLIRTLKKAILELKAEDSGAKITEDARSAIMLTFNRFVSKELPKNETERRKERDIALEIEKAYLDVIDKAGAKKVEAAFEFENAPWERWSFGLMSAFFIANANSRERVKLTDAGFYAFEPPKNPLPSVIFNIHPRKFDPKAADMSLAERFRFFVGAILTPDIGGCLGAGFAIMRGLSLNAGIALIGFRSYKDPQSIVVDGKDMRKPGNPADPFQSKWGHVPFVGISYSFQ